MKYAREVVELLAAYPGREFKAQQIVRYVCPNPQNTRERRAVRMGVHRVLSELRAVGTVLSRPPIVARGGYAVYWWKV